MNADINDARRALGDIETARGRSMTLHGYAASWPTPIIWGVVWLCANLATYYAFFPRLAWPVGIAIGSILTCLVVARMSRRWSAHGFDRKLVIRFGLMFFVIVAGLTAIGSIIDIRSSDQSNALISLLVAIVYMLTGVFQGARIFVAGLFIAAAVLIGFHAFREWFDLWMAFVGGGVLIGTGLWLRTAA